MNRSNYRSRHANTVPGWGPAPGWDQPLPGWTPLLDHSPPPLRAAGSVARWWWPTLAVASFLAVAVYVTGHDPGLSQRGLVTIALAALVVVLLTIHRTAGPGALARAAAEYTVVALLAGLLATGGAVVDQQPTNPSEPSQPNRANAQGAAGDAQPAVIRAVTKVLRAGVRVVRAIAGAVRWLVDLWHRADQQAAAKGEAMAVSPRSPTPSVPSIWRSHP